MFKSTILKALIFTSSLSLLFLLIPSLAFAQSGTFKGQVLDKITNEPLIGASVIIENTSMGNATDIDGNFIIRGVPVGTYSIKVSYIGYITITKQITIAQDAALEENYKLDPQAITIGESVVVTAQMKAQNDAINQQLQSNTIINVVSSDKIRELPDQSASAALSRLPGVSIMNGDQIVIRGVQAKLNQVLINGIELPSTDMGANSSTRATNLGFISSNLLSGIEVIKALTPDMDANTIGGVVNLRLREAPADFHFDALAQANYNATDRVGDNYKFWASVSDRFLDGKLGVFLQANMDRTDGGDQRASITPVLLGTGIAEQDAFGQATYMPNGAQLQYDANIIKNSGGSLILDYQLPDGKVVLQNTYAGNVTDQLRNYVLLNFDLTRVTFTPDRSLYGKDLWINALQVENNFGDIKVNASLSHSASKQYTDYGYSPSLFGAAWSQFYHQSGIAPFGFDASNIPIRYNSSAVQQAMTLEGALDIYSSMNPAYADSATIAGWTHSIYRTFNQHLYNASLDVSMPVNFSSDITSTFKAGGKYVRTTRINDIQEHYARNSENLYLNPEANSYLGVGPSKPVRFKDVMNNDFERGQYYLNDMFDGGFKYSLDRDKYDTWLKLSEKSWPELIMPSDSYKDDWTGSEQFSAGYLMGTFNIGPRMTVLGGARFESYRMKYHAQFTYVTHTVYGNCVTTADGSISVNDSTSPSQISNVIPYSAFNVDRTDDNIFPGVQLQYKVNDWSDVRFAYTTGISRPDYTAIIPKVCFYAGNFELGNPMLKPATVKNIDIVGSFHNNSIGLFTISAFYKEIKDQMYNTTIFYMHRNQYASNVYLPDSAFLAQRFGFAITNAQRVQVNLNNKALGFIRGIEVDWQTNFWYLPKPLNTLVLNVNYTHSGSNTNYTVLTPTITTVYDTVNGRVRRRDINTTEETTYSGRLIQQANDVINVALGVDHKGFSGRISFSMTGNVINSIGTRPEEASFTGNIYRWDFTLKQDLPIEGLSLSLNGTNIFHNGIETYRNFRRSPDAPITKNLVAVLYSPSFFDLNLRYTF